MNPGDLNQALDEVLCRALSEDLGIEVTADTPVGDLVHQDVTTRNAVEAGVVGRATLFAKEAGVFAGGAIFERILGMLDPSSAVDAVVPDGQIIVPGDVVLHARGEARALLVAERTALNLVQRMSGVASRTRERSTASRGRASVSWTRARPPRGSACSTSTPCGLGAGPITGSGSTTRRW